MVSTIYSMGINGINSFLVKIESDVSSGMPMCDIVGLPDIAVKESKNRVRAAIKNCGYNFPVSRITINLAPADIRKVGSLYDLPILLSILQASGQINVNFEESIFLGELSLTGEVRRVNGVLSMVIEAKNKGFKNIFVPFDNASEASIISGINVYAVKNVSELINHLLDKSNLSPHLHSNINLNNNNEFLDFSFVKGQYLAKRAIEIAVAGNHNILMIGPPGSGKSMLAKHIKSILPDMTFDEMIETTSIYSISGQLNNENPIITERPFRAPHHSISPSGLSGGGSIPRPGEISLAHNGILFLDEFSEFSRISLESLRQPLEDNNITISRVQSSVTFPCSIMLVAAMNPCPCGYYGHPTKHCTCSMRAIEKYMSKISGPTLDRIDIHIEVPPLNFDEINSPEKSESSCEIKKRILNARKIQNKRYLKYGLYSNAKVPPELISDVCKISENAKRLLKESFNAMSMSARVYNKILKVARTIADLESSETISELHIHEAIQYRNLDRKYWKN